MSDKKKEISGGEVEGEGREGKKRKKEKWILMNSEDLLITQFIDTLWMRPKK